MCRPTSLDRRGTTVGTTYIKHYLPPRWQSYTALSLLQLGKDILFDPTLSEPKFITPRLFP